MTDNENQHATSSITYQTANLIINTFVRALWMAHKNSRQENLLHLRGREKGTHSTSPLITPSESHIVKHFHRYDLKYLIRVNVR